MFLLILVVTSIYRSHGLSLFRSHPVDTVTVTGRSVSLSCTLRNVQCDAHDTAYTLYWERGLQNDKIFMGLLVYDYNRVDESRYSTSLRGCTWFLHIQNVIPDDEGYYHCYIYNYRPSVKTERSNQAQIDVVSPIDTTVTPSHIWKRYGENVTFSCQTNRTIENGFNIKWYKIPAGESLQMLIKETQTIQFNDNNKMMTMMNLQQQENNMTLTCLIYKGLTPVTGSNSHASLSVNPSEETMTTIENIVTSQNSPSDQSQGTVHPEQSPTTLSQATNTDSSPSGPLDRQSTPHAPQSQGTVHPEQSPTTSSQATNTDSSPSGLLDPQSTPPAPQTSSPLSTKKQDPDLDSNNPFSGSTCTDSTITLVGWSLAAVLFCLLISTLLYIIVTKRRSEANHNSTHVVQKSPDEDAEAYEEVETQLHGQDASTGHKETVPSSYQELIYK